MINNFDAIALLNKFIKTDKISNNVKISEQKGGLFNDVLKVEDEYKSWYLKKYLEQSASKIFSPPKISPEIRSQLAYFVQKECYHLNKDIKTVPDLFIDVDENILIIEGVLHPITMIDLISQNSFKIEHIELISKTIARLHAGFSGNSEICNDPIYRNQEFRDFKLKLQYQNMAEQLEEKCSNLIYHLLSTYKSQYFTVLHGDLNSRNIVVNSITQEVGIIDFEQSHVGNPIYDITYFLCEVYISCLNFENSELLFKSVEAFLKTYMEYNPDFEIINYLEEMKMHLAVQIIYRFLGPSRDSWTFYINENRKNHIMNYAKEMLVTKNEKHIDIFFQK